LLSLYKTMKSLICSFQLYLLIIAFTPSYLQRTDLAEESRQIYTKLYLWFKELPGRVVERHRRDLSECNVPMVRFVIERAIEAYGDDLVMIFVITTQQHCVQWFRFVLLASFNKLLNVSERDLIAPPAMPLILMKRIDGRYC
jgi:hypothetical protein